jgi:hypothetical protein
MKNGPQNYCFFLPPGLETGPFVLRVMSRSVVVQEALSCLLPPWKQKSDPGTYLDWVALRLNKVHPPFLDAIIEFAHATLASPDVCEVGQSYVCEVGQSCLAIALLSGSSIDAPRAACVLRGSQFKPWATLARRWQVD